MVVNSETVVQAAYQRAATVHNPYLEEIKQEILRLKAADHAKVKKVYLNHKENALRCKCELCKQIKAESNAIRSIRLSQFESWDTYSPLVQDYYRRRDNARYERKQLEQKFSTFLYKSENE